MSENNPERIILHHSLTNDNIYHDNFQGIYNYHTEVNGWSDIGYHWVLEYDNGILQWKKGRDELTRGAHCKEDGKNYTSIGICVIGNYDVDYLNEEQIQMILQKQKELEIRFDRKLPLELHREYASYKTCPGTNINLELFSDDSIENILLEVTSNPDEWLDYIETAKVVAEGNTGALQFGKYLEDLIIKLYKT